jgi:hypothetical protein
LLFRCKAGASTSINVRDKFLPVGFIPDDPAFATGKRGFGVIKCFDERRAAAFILNPKRHSLLHGLGGVMNAARFHGMAHNVGLLRRQIDFHQIIIRFDRRLVKRGVKPP